jgi:hypothetical protein
MYKTQNNWKDSILGFMKGEDRKTFIANIFKSERLKLAPSHYDIKDPILQKSRTLGKLAKGDRICTTSDAEYLASITPGAKYIDIYTKVNKKTQNIDFKKGLEWKVKKKDGPDPGSYPEKESAFANFTSKASPKWKQGKDERRFFTTVIAKRKKFVPGAGNYEIIDYNKIHRRLSSRRH